MACAAAAVLTVLVTPDVGASSIRLSAGAATLAPYLDLPMPNRDASAAPGGVNAVLPTDSSNLASLLNRARGRHTPPHRYVALLQQYWLAAACERAGIDLRSWNPRAGINANRQNLDKSYTLYGQLQLHHRELRWAGQAGQVGADFGGGLLDLMLANEVLDLPGIAAAVHELDKALVQRLGPGAMDLLPSGLAATLRAATRITPADVDRVIGMILVMQKNIFSDLMPMHVAYVTKGLPALQEMRDAGLFGDDVVSVWRDVASADPARITSGNEALLRREQSTAIGAQWAEVRRYRGDVGEALTYMSTVVGSPSVAGVVPLRLYHQVRYTITAPNGRRAAVTLPLPDWNWAVFDSRWSYIRSQLVPKYSYEVAHNWPAMAAIFNTPHEIRMQQHRPTANIPAILQSLAAGVRIQYI